MTLTINEIAAFLAPYGVHLDPWQCSAIGQYVDLLVAWNRTVNLTAVDEPSEIVARHFGESVFAGRLLPLLRGGRLADVGTGAGFPGLALKIAFPQLQISLIEPNLRKSAFLTEVVRALELRDVHIVRERYEELPGERGAFDYICSRALGDYKNLLLWSRRALNSHGNAVLWLGSDDSMRLSRTKGWNWAPPTVIPDSRRRVILMGTPQQNDN